MKQSVLQNTSCYPSVSTGVPASAQAHQVNEREG